MQDHPAQWHRILLDCLVPLKTNREATAKVSAAMLDTLMDRAPSRQSREWLCKWKKSSKQDAWRIALPFPWRTHPMTGETRALRVPPGIVYMAQVRPAIHTSAKCRKRLQKLSWALMEFAWLPGSRYPCKHPILLMISGEFLQVCWGVLRIPDQARALLRGLRQCHHRWRPLPGTLLPVPIMKMQAEIWRLARRWSLQATVVSLRFSPTSDYCRCLLAHRPMQSLGLPDRQNQLAQYQNLTPLGAQWVAALRANQARRGASKNIIQLACPV